MQQCPTFTIVFFTLDTHLAFFFYEPCVCQQSCLWCFWDHTQTYVPSLSTLFGALVLLLVLAIIPSAISTRVHKLQLWVTSIVRMEGKQWKWLLMGCSCITVSTACAAWCEKETTSSRCWMKIPGWREKSQLVWALVMKVISRRANL